MALNSNLILCDFGKVDPLVEEIVSVSFLNTLGKNSDIRRKRSREK